MPMAFRSSPLPLAGLALFILALILWRAGGTLDLSLHHLFRLDPGDPILPAIRGLTILGGLAVLAGVTLVAIGGLVLRGDRRRAIWLFATIVTGRLAIEVTKLALLRERPPLVDRLDSVKSFSFPSAHAADAALLWLALVLLFPARRHWLAPLAIAMTLAIGWSRLALAVHWTSDVIAGFGLALFWVGTARHWLPPAPGPISRA